MVALCAVAACLYDRGPIGPSDVRRSNSSSQGGIVYAEERRAVELARAIPELAGFFFDTSGNVVVLLKETGRAQPTKALLRPRFANELARGRRTNAQADIIVQPAQYTFLELKEWRDRLTNADVLTAPGAVWLDLDEAQNRVVIGLDHGADPAALRILAHDLGVPAEAVEFEVTGPYVAQETLQDEFRPIEGGIQIQRVSGTSPVSCTLAFTAVWQDQDVFLTAGHCSPDPTGADGVEQFQPTAPLTSSDSASITAVGREVAHVSEPCGNDRCSYSDAAIYELIADTVPPIPSEPWVLGRVARPAGGCFPGPCDPPILELGSSPYWVIDTTHGSFVVNDLVSKIGAATGWSQGSVSKTCVNVSPTQGVTLYCQMYASYGQDEGDSGAPILLDIGCCGDSTVTLGGIHSGKAGKNAVFSPWSGIVQDYGSLVVVQQDTARPPVPTEPLTLPADSSTTVRRPGGHPDNVYYRNIFELAFDDSTSGPTVRNVLARYEAEIIGGRTFPGLSKGAYVIRVPDPGPAFDDLEELLSRLEAEPGVHFVRAMMFRVYWDFRSRFPNEAPGTRRVNWQNRDSVTDGTRSRLAVRAPLAWGCETGTYASERVRVGVLDVVFASGHPDLPAARVFPIFDPTDVDVQLLVDPVLRSHGTAVAGVMAAVGDNGAGVTGVMWGADLHLYPYGQGTRSVRDPFERFDEGLGDAARRDVRVMVTSLSFGDVGSARDVRRLRESLRQYLSAGLGNVFVLAASEIRDSVGRRLTLQELETTTDPGLTPLDRAAAQLLETFPNQIIIVAGTDSSNRFWAPSDYYTGGTQIVAPATDILTLADPADFADGTIVGEGNSFAAPFVAGVAGLLLAGDPTLIGPEITDLILRGAQLPRWNPQTGQMESPQPVSGAPDTVYQLDAYSTLKLAAQRQGAPLCGNRVWVANQQVVAERDAVSHITETLITLGEAGGDVNARHGGRRIEVFTASGARAFELEQGQWVETQDAATTPAGGTFHSMLATSHDLDSTASFNWWTMPNATAFEVSVVDVGTQTRTIIDTVVAPRAQFSDSACVQLNDEGACSGWRPSGADERVEGELIFPSVGGRLLLALTYFVTRDVAWSGFHACAFPDTTGEAVSCQSTSYEQRTERAELWAVNLQSRQATHLWTYPARVFWFGASEDGAQLVSGEGVNTLAWTWQDTSTGWEQVFTDPGTLSGCAVRYRRMTDRAEVAPAITAPDACTTFLGAGTIAPAPPVSSEGR